VYNYHSKKIISDENLVITGILWTLLGSNSFCAAQKQVMPPKSIFKNWVLVPKLSFKSQGVYGNDSVNFMKTERNIQTESFYIFDK